MELKQCSKCKQWLDKSNFNKDKRKKDGLSSYCKTCANNDAKLYYERHREQKLQYQRKYKEENRNIINERSRNYYQSNHDRIVIKRRENYQIYKDNVTFRLNNIMHKVLWRAIRENNINIKYINVLGYTAQQLKEHLEKQFDESMNWQNYGSCWEVDHIIPINMFNYQSVDDKEFKICWSLMNLRPLEKLNNMSRPIDSSDISDDLKLSILNQDI